MNDLGDLPDGNPFPGLRPFRESEEFLFFGREAQVDAMVDKLAATHFLAVVGSSGSGKSSLVNCGLCPALHRGLMCCAGSAWRVAYLRPGNLPVRALAQALAAPGVLYEQMDTGDFTPTEFMEATLRMSKLGLLDAFAQARLGPRTNLLVVVDQFEELFRYRKLAASATSATSAGASPSAAAEDATAFVNLLLEARAHDAAVHVVITMRSDFLGECAQFFGLPEAINQGQYLVPRMTRDERRAAIIGPIGVAGARIDPVLLTRLVNDVGDNPDQLSILQHALNRTWDHWRRQGQRGPIALEHYEAVGTMARALNQHADEAWREVGDERRQVVCENLFKALTDKGTDARGIRRPTRFDTLCELTESPAEALAEVIEVFRKPARSFLMPPAGTPLAADTVIDISHESLMRVWQRLDRWGDEEARSAQMLRRLAESAALNQAGRASLLRGPDLQLALEWLRQGAPNEAWARQYGQPLQPVRDFVQRSEAEARAEREAEAARRAQQASLEREQARAKQQRKLYLAGFGVALFLLTLFGSLVVVAFRERDTAEAARAQAEQARAQAEHARAEAERARADAEEALQKAAYAEQQSTRERNNAQAAQNLLDKAANYDPAVRASLRAAEASKPIVYLQYRDDGQRALAQRLGRQLGGKGYSAPDVEKVRAGPRRLELRYFRKEDAADATELAKLLQGWNWGPVKPTLIGGFENRSLLRQFEIWFGPVDHAEIERLVAQIDAPTAEVRKSAAQTLQSDYPASPEAIATVLRLFEPDRIDGLSPSGRLNALYYLTRTSALAWDDELRRSARELLARVGGRADVGEQTRAELERLRQMLDSQAAEARAEAAAGEPGPSPARRSAAAEIAR
ncbi:MAG: hypothetical protein QM674_20140 [Burkholderiaceae bacterium]